MDGDARLAGRVVTACERAAATGLLRVCDVSLWEVAALESLGRLRLAVPVTAWLEEAVSTPGLDVVRLDAAIAAESSRLPGRLAGDPVDRIIVAASRLGGATLVTADPNLLTYAAAGYLSAIPCYARSV